MFQWIPVAQLRNRNREGSFWEQMARTPLKSLAEEENRIRSVDVLWSTVMGVIQQEKSKLRAIPKNHVLSTLEYAFVTLIRGIC